MRKIVTQSLRPLRPYGNQTLFWYLMSTLIYAHIRLQTSCYKFVHKLSTSCVLTACSQLLQQVWNKLLTTCNKLDGIIRLVTKLFWQVWYSHDLTRMLQSWRHKLVTILLYQRCWNLLQDVRRLHVSSFKLSKCTRKNLTSLPTSRQQVVFALLVPSCQQVWNKLLTTCKNLVDIIRLLQGCSNKSDTVMI
jgi:hypothetical protein